MPNLFRHLGLQCIAEAVYPSEILKQVQDDAPGGG